MKYEYQDVNSLFKKMVIDTKEMLFTMKQVEDLLHDPEFEETMKTFSWEQLETLDRLFALHNEYALELRKIMV